MITAGRSQHAASGAFDLYTDHWRSTSAVGLDSLTSRRPRPQRCDKARALHSAVLRHGVPIALCAICAMHYGWRRHSPRRLRYCVFHYLAGFLLLYHS